MKFEMYHSCITVLDLEKSMKFYQDALGLEEIRRIEGEDGSYKIVFLGHPDGACQLELTWYAERKEPYNLGDNEMGCICFENKNFGVYFIEDPDGYWMEIVPIR